VFEQEEILIDISYLDFLSVFCHHTIIHHQSLLYHHHLSRADVFAPVNPIVGIFGKHLSAL